MELESGGLGVRGQESGARGQGSGVGVKSWSWRAKLSEERKSERADTAYSPRFREEELPATANERADKHSNLFNAETQSRRVRRESWSLELELESEVVGGAKVRASGYGVFAEVPRGGASGHRQRASRRYYFFPPLNAEEPERARR